MNKNSGISYRCATGHHWSLSSQNKYRVGFEKDGIFEIKEVQEVWEAAFQVKSWWFVRNMHCFNALHRTQYIQGKRHGVQALPGGANPD